jgi:hypothetical protein
MPTHLRFSLSTGNHPVVSWEFLTATADNKDDFAEHQLYVLQAHIESQEAKQDKNLVLHEKKLLQGSRKKPKGRRKSNPKGRWKSNPKGRWKSNPKGRRKSKPKGHNRRRKAAYAKVSDYHTYVDGNELGGCSDSDEYYLDSNEYYALIESKKKSHTYDSDSDLDTNLFSDPYDRCHGWGNTCFCCW